MELRPMMREPAKETIAQNLIEALEQVRLDLDRVELWAAALGCFQSPAPEYQPNDHYLLCADRDKSGRPQG
jgi:hypothetical protein